MSLFIENILLGFFLAIVLGPVVIEIANRGLKQGFLKSFLAVCGTMTAELIYFSAVFFGIYKFATGLFIQTLLGIFGIIFILYLAANNIAEFILDGISKKDLQKVNPFISAFNITFFYPLNVFMWTGLIAVSVAKDPSFFSSSGILIGILSAYLIVCFASSFAHKFVGEKGARWISLASGLFMIYYGIKMIIDIFLR